MHHALQNELISVMQNKMASRPGLLPASLLVTSASVCDAVISKSCSVCRFEMTEKSASGFHSYLGFQTPVVYGTIPKPQHTLNKVPDTAK